MAECHVKAPATSESSLQPCERAPQLRLDGAGRIAALDALRGGAMLLGICVHSCLSYMRGGMPGLVWGIHEQNTSALFDCLFWWVHAFRLPLFFFIAGFFAVPLYDARGLRGFLVHRGKRLLVPF